MKRIFITLIAVVATCVAMAQTYELNIDAQVLKNYKTLKKGTSVHIYSMTHDISFDTDGKAINSYTINTDKGKIVVKEKLEKVLDVAYKDAQDFWDAQAIFNVLEELSKKGTQEELRAEMESDVLEYINRVKKYGLEFNDPYLETYMYGVISKLAPYVLIDGRPGNVNLLIISDPTANASMYPNGTLVITTGLIALLHSEDELAAILSHEIAHFVLDHSVQNYNKAVERQKRAEFWAGFATVLTAAAEGVAAARNPYYRPGAATIAVANASSQIALQVCERVGMNYSRKQEEEADAIACELIKVMGYKENALSSALSRIEVSMKEERSIEMYFASDHPALISRILSTGNRVIPRNKEFEKIISFAVADAASMKVEDRRYRQALPLFSQNIENNVATADDYIQKANCLLYLKNDKVTDAEVLNLITEAKRIEPGNINIYKTEILALLRQKKYAEASTLLEQYKNMLVRLVDSHKESPSETQLSVFNFASSERVWADNMLTKLRAF